jgi:hypothetical protein
VDRVDGAHHRHLLLLHVHDDLVDT